jgi:Ni,Fe-hydrogenase maturation factor
MDAPEISLGARAEDGGRVDPVVGCQPADVDELGEGLSPAVEGAVEAAVAEVERTVRGWLEHATA